MNNSEVSEIVRQFQQYCGIERFKKFKDELRTTCRERNRLMYWQEKLWQEFTESAQINIPATLRDLERLLLEGKPMPKVFKSVSRNENSETYICEDTPDLRL